MGGLIQASHPFPIAMVVSLTLLLGFASTRGSPDAGRLALAAASMLLSQLAIGWSNDYLDRERDAHHQPDKPVPSGLVAPRLLLILAAAVLAGSAAAAALVGPVVLLLLLAGTSCGFAYNLGLKDTRFSWATYVAAFALLPPFVWAAVDEFQGDFAWLYPIGAPLAIAAHIANTLPDIDADRSAGASGLVVRLGRRRAVALLFTCLTTPLGLIAISSAWLRYDTTAITLTLVAYGLLVGAAYVVYSRPRTSQAARLGFRIVAPACVLLAAGWIASV